jgi:hypothetical protein
MNTHKHTHTYTYTYTHTYTHTNTHTKHTYAHTYKNTSVYHVLKYMQVSALKQHDSPEIWVAAGEGCSFLQKFGYVSTKPPSKGLVYCPADLPGIKVRRQTYRTCTLLIGDVCYVGFTRDFFVLFVAVLYKTGVKLMIVIKFRALEILEILCLNMCSHLCLIVALGTVQGNYRTSSTA